MLSHLITITKPVAMANVCRGKKPRCVYFPKSVKHVESVHGLRGNAVFGHGSSSSDKCVVRGGPACWWVAVRDRALISRVAWVMRARYRLPVSRILNILKRPIRTWLLELRPQTLLGDALVKISVWSAEWKDPLVEMKAYLVGNCFVPWEGSLTREVLWCLVVV